MDSHFDFPTIQRFNDSLFFVLPSPLFLLRRSAFDVRRSTFDVSVSSSLQRFNSLTI